MCFEDTNFSFKQRRPNAFDILHDLFLKTLSTSD